MKLIKAQILVFCLLFIPPVVFGQLYGQSIFKIESFGTKRRLPEHMMGFNAATAFYEFLLDDTVRLKHTKKIFPTILRFPGGSIANYYHWETGNIQIPVKANSSAYTRMMSRVADYSRKRHPTGVYIEKMTSFSRKVGAEILLVPNLETSSIASQSAWFKSMKNHQIVPRYVELGNEFWVAMLNDPNVIDQFPDVRSAMKAMESYLAGIRPYLSKNAQIAVQGAASDYYALSPVGRRNSLIWRMFNWDRDLENAPWFDAITIHLYPRPEVVVGRRFTDLAENIDHIFPATMARIDTGLDRTVASIKRRNPGKEIWVTEWNPNHLQFSLENRDPGLTGMMMHLTARMFLAFLRHPEITMSTFHMLSFNGQIYSVFSFKNGRYTITGPGLVIRWFHQAAKGPALYTIIRIPGVNRIQGRGLIRNESYLEMEGGLFEKNGRFTLIVQNTGRTPATLDLSSLLEGNNVRDAESFTTPDLTKIYLLAPEVKKITPSPQIQVPALSLTRVTW